MRNSTCLQPSVATTVALPVIYSFLCPAGSFGNILAVWILSRQAPTKRTQCIYLVNLVIANLLVCSTMPFLAVYFARGYQWTHDSLTCKIVHHVGTLIMHVSMYVTITILCSIALSQYATLKKTNDTQFSEAANENFYRCVLEKFRQPKFAKYLCIFIWLIVLCITVTAIAYGAQEKALQGTSRCYSSNVEAGEFYAMIAASLATSWFFVSFMMVLLSYYSLTRHLSKIQRNTCIGGKHLIYGTVKRNILVIQVILTVCFLPYHIFRPVFYILVINKDCPRLNYLVEIKNFLTCLAAAKSSLDPVITLLLDKTFKKSLYGLFKKSTPEHHKRKADIFTDEIPEM
ncbi:PREDICTED: probable G-protein coupled receptor 82 [Chaetura pelagica]|uniref:probable G-protein coupled receptor 82 n=1 Tax=Chaetura pelagica TaxID=8897 RepID=UPI00052395E4|nr:PREDICTED: probable G-protein coupled receptor 82 [Chaetura pelagica]